MVHSVMAVSTVGKPRHEEERKQDDKQRETTPNTLFSQFLEQEIEEQKKASMNCKTVTYGQDSRLHTFEYLSREYR